MYDPNQKFESEGHRLFVLHADLIKLQHGSIVQSQWRNRSPVEQARWRVLAEYFGRDYPGTRKPHIMVPKSCVKTVKMK